MYRGEWLLSLVALLAWLSSTILSPLPVTMSSVTNPPVWNQRLKRLHPACASCNALHPYQAGTLIGCAYLAWALNTLRKHPASWAHMMEAESPDMFPLFEGLHELELGCYNAVDDANSGLDRMRETSILRKQEGRGLRRKQTHLKWWVFEEWCDTQHTIPY